ncbi:MAG: hypothetical protein BRD49_01170 [Bacteroidetes bacterium SW_10_40_5]|nr:MAG: hypothetical protein BRD49_01170 [Bacteroidetes bacterium SW_10_40_5]
MNSIKNGRQYFKSLLNKMFLDKQKVLKDSTISKLSPTSPRKKQKACQGELLSISSTILWCSLSFLG